MNTFTSLGKVGMTKWTEEQAEWVYKNSKADSLEKKVARWVLKKKFNKTINN